MKLLRGLRFFGSILTVLGLVLIGIYLWSEWDLWRYQKLGEEELLHPDAKPVPRIPSGVLGTLEVPRLDLKVVVSEGVDAKTLRHFAGHVPLTAQPGEPGNAVIAAHRDGLFRPLRNLERGDLIRFHSSDGDFNYRVQSFAIVTPNAVEVLQASSGQRLTLITCYPFDFIGHAPRRFIVTATRSD